MYLPMGWRGQASRPIPIPPIVTATRLGRSMGAFCLHTAYRFKLYSTEYRDTLPTSTSHDETIQDWMQVSPFILYFLTSTPRQLPRGIQIKAPALHTRVAYRRTRDARALKILWPHLDGGNGRPDSWVRRKVYSIAAIRSEPSYRSVGLVGDREVGLLSPVEASRARALDLLTLGLTTTLNIVSRGVDGVNYLPEENLPTHLYWKLMWPSASFGVWVNKRSKPFA